MVLGVAGVGMEFVQSMRCRGVRLAGWFVVVVIAMGFLVSWSCCLRMQAGSGLALFCLAVPFAEGQRVMTMHGKPAVVDEHAFEARR